MTETSTTTAWYVYGVARATPELEAAGSHVGVRFVHHGPLAAIIGEVPLAEFEHDALVERLNDRAWLEERARAHEDVLLAVAAAAPVLPFRFGTVYRELEDVVQLLSARRVQLERVLERLRGCVEVGVKAWLGRAELDQFLDDAPGEPAPDANLGRSYLERRSRQQLQHREATARSAELAAAAHARLSAVAIDGVANRPQASGLTGRKEQMLLNGAYLVPADDTALAREVERLRVEHAPLRVEYEVTGPWPPHNFVQEADE